MIRVTKQFGITQPVPFIDVHVDDDVPLFIDPSALRNSAPGSLKRDAHDLVVDFFSEVLRLRRSASPKDHIKGEGLLNRLHEPNETRLGLSRGKSEGHAFGPELARRLWGALATNPACASAALNKLEDVPLFIDQVGNDLISDLTTRVTFSVLADFTHSMMMKYPQLRMSTTTSSIDVWDSNTHAWINRSITLPYAGGKQLLLVPTDWVYWRLLMNSTQFYNLFSTQAVQDRSGGRPRGGTGGISKKMIKSMNTDTKKLNTTEAAADPELVSTYRNSIDASYKPLTSKQIEKRIRSRR